MARASVWAALGFLAAFIGSARAERVESATRVHRLHAVQASALGRGPAHKPQAVLTQQLTMDGLLPPVFGAAGQLLLAGATGVMALDAAGRVLWEQRIGSVVAGPVSLGDDRFLVIARDARPWEVHGSGEVRAWPAHLRADSAPVVLDQGGVAFATDQGEVEMLDGSGVSLVRVPSGVHGRLRLLALPGARVAAVSAEPWLGVVSLTAGLVRRAALPVGGLLAPVLDPTGGLWLVSEGGRVLRLGADAELRLSATLDKQVPVGAALGTDGALRITTAHGQLICVGPDGKERFQRRLDGPAGVPLLDADDTAFVVTRQGSLFAIERDGALRYRVGSVATDAPRPVLGPDGTLWLASRRGVLQAWR